MQVSVAIATYNGENYLQEQLDSLLEQERRPDEVIINDDRSKDGTLALAHSFAQHAPFPVHIEQNKYNVGFAENFSRVLSRCSGDIVFLSDQDDVWFPNKIKRVLEEFEALQEKAVIVHDAVLADNALEPTSYTRFSQAELAGIAAYNQGACTAIRGGFLRFVLPIPSDVYTHDNWIHSVADMLGVKSVLRIELQYFRRHPMNVSATHVSRLTPLTGRALWQARLKKIRRPGRTAEYYVRDRVAKRYILLEWLYTNMQEITAGYMRSSAIRYTIRNLHREIGLLEVRLSFVGSPRRRRAPKLVLLYVLTGRRLYGGRNELLKDLSFPLFLCVYGVNLHRGLAEVARKT